MVLVSLLPIRSIGPIHNLIMHSAGSGFATPSIIFSAQTTTRWHDCSRVRSLHIRTVELLLTATRPNREVTLYEAPLTRQRIC